MPTTIKLKNSVTTTNAPSSLAQGEVAINITDKKVWVGNAATTPIQLLGDGGSVTFTSLTVTGVSTFSAGTVSAPSITTSGDTNTGIYFPAADTIAFTEGGVESMRIDSSGNVGIGTASPTALLHVNGTARATSMSLNGVSIGDYSLYSGMVARVSNGGGIGINSANASDNAYIYFGSGTSSGAQQSAAIGRIGGDVLALFTASAERMRIDSSGNVCVGTTTALITAANRGNITVNGSSSSIYTLGVNGVISGWMYADSTATYISSGNTTARPIVFETNAAERMRITSGGEVYIAGTTDQGAYNLQVNGTGVWGAGAYVNGSDERIKENISPIESGLDVVEKLNPVTYRYKEEWSKDQSTQTGFIAQELLTALDGQIYVDGVVQQGGEYMSVAYQNIIPILTKAIQELNAKVVELEAKLNSK